MWGVAVFGLWRFDTWRGVRLCGVFGAEPANRGQYHGLGTAMVGFGTIQLAAIDGQFGDVVGQLAQCLVGVRGIGCGWHRLCFGHTAIGKPIGVMHEIKQAACKRLQAACFCIQSLLRQGL